MIPRTPVLDHILSKRLDGQQQQQQQWQQVFIKTNNKKPTNNKFTILLDKHIDSSNNYNYFSPLNLPNNPFSQISSSFPSIMPTLKSKTVTSTSVPPASVTPASSKQKKQSSIETFYDKKSHTRKGSKPGKSSDSDDGITAKKNSANRCNKTDAITQPGTESIPNAGINLTGQEVAADSDNELEVLNRAGPTTRTRRKPMELPSYDSSDSNSSKGKTSDDDDDSDFGKPEWDIPKSARDDSDSSDSDELISNIIDKVSSKVYSRSGRGGRGGGRGGGSRRNNNRGRGRGGGLGPDRDSDFTNRDSDYTDEESAVVVANGAKRRKGIANHPKKRDTVMADEADNTISIPTHDDGALTTPTGHDTDPDTVMVNDEHESELAPTTNDDLGDDDDEGAADADGDLDDDDDDGAADADGEAVLGDDDADADADPIDTPNQRKSKDSFDDEDDDYEQTDKDDEDKTNDSDDDDNDERANNPDSGEDKVDGSSTTPIYDSKWLFEFQPKEKVERFTVDSIIGCLATAVRSVDPTAHIASWDNASNATIWSKETVPKTDAVMEHFVEDPHTSKVGPHGRLHGRVRFITSISLMDIKLNPEFGAWIREQGLFLDLSEIPTTRPKLIGFFDRKLPHTSRIDIFQGFLKQCTNISRPYQVFSQTINAGDNTDLKCYAYVLKADSKDAAIIIKELASMTKSSSPVKFYAWEDFRDHTDLVVKRQLITDMTAFARNHASFVFHGIAANEYMRIAPKTRSPGTNVASKNTKQLSSLQSAFQDEENQKDADYSNLRCLDYMQQIFVDSDQLPIFKRIDGPYNGKIEVTFEKFYFNKVRDIEKQYVNILASKMTDLSKSKCFDPWPIPLTPASMATPWTPPKASRRPASTASANPYRKPGATVEYSLTSTSNMSYKDASTLGRRQIDIPKTLVVQAKSDNASLPKLATTSNTSDTTMTSTKDSALLLEMQAAQKAFQIQYDEKLAKLDATILRIETEAKATRKTLAALSIEVTAKYTEIQDNQRKSETRITKAVKKEAATTQKMLAKLFRRLGGTDTETQDSDDDTTMKHSNSNGSRRTNHPKDKNIDIHQRHRNNERVAARVK